MSIVPNVPGLFLREDLDVPRSDLCRSDVHGQTLQPFGIIRLGTHVPRENRCIMGEKFLFIGLRKRNNFLNYFATNEIYLEFQQRTCIFKLQLTSLIGIQ